MKFVNKNLLREILLKNDKKDIWKVDVGDFNF